MAFELALLFAQKCPQKILDRRKEASGKMPETVLLGLALGFRAEKDGKKGEQM